MKKIPTMFVRDWKGDRSRVTDECHLDCLWVFKGEGIATRKRDGKAVRIDAQGILWRRYDAAKNEKRPMTFESCGDDEETGKEPGWVVGCGSDEKWADEAVGDGAIPAPGTYELCGPKIGTRAGANPEGLDRHCLFRHGGEGLAGVPRSFLPLKEWLEANEMEGIVFHHPDGRMAKIKRSDFGIPWPSQKRSRTAAEVAKEGV